MRFLGGGGRGEIDGIQGGALCVLLTMIIRFYMVAFRVCERVARDMEVLWGEQNIIDSERGILETPSTPNTLP